MSETDPQRPTPGFGHSKRRVAVELSVFVGGLMLLVAIGWVLLSNLADFVAEGLPMDADVAIGEQAFAQLVPPERRCKSEAAQRYVEELARPLIEESGSSLAFHFVVSDDPEVNAFALPGGFVSVNRGLLENAETGDEVAAVLAHELAHVTLRHGTRRVVRQLGSVVLLSLLVGGTDFESLGLAAAGLVGVAYDRDQEAEADREGQRLLREAGISPLAMAEFFRRLAEKGPSVPTLLSTHPDPGGRSQRAREAAAGFVASTKLPSPSGLGC